MRTEDDVEHFSTVQRVELERCEVCGGGDPDCDCRRAFELRVAAYEACIPRDFWDPSELSVEFNKEAWEEIVRPYCKRLSIARSRGYGLLLSGDNGAGKTMFVSFALVEALKWGYSAYYVTLPSLDHWMKRGFSDREIAARLDWLLSSDFVAIDELGKEHKGKSGRDFTGAQVERILKARYDDSLPTLLASNADPEALEKMYGATFASMLVGKFKVAVLEPGDFRERSAATMATDMGY